MIDRRRPSRRDAATLILALAAIVIGGARPLAAAPDRWSRELIDRPADADAPGYRLQWSSLNISTSLNLQADQRNHRLYLSGHLHTDDPRIVAVSMPHLTHVIDRDGANVLTENHVEAGRLMMRASTYRAVPQRSESSGPVTVSLSCSASNFLRAPARARRIVGELGMLVAESTRVYETHAPHENQVVHFGRGESWVQFTKVHHRNNTLSIEAEYESIGNLFQFSGEHPFVVQVVAVDDEGNEAHYNASSPQWRRRRDGAIEGSVRLNFRLGNNKNAESITLLRFIVVEQAIEKDIPFAIVPPEAP